MSKFDNPWKAFMFVGVIGVDLAVCTIAGSWLGKTLDSHFGTSPLFLLLGLLLGMTIGVYSIYRLIKPFLED